MPLPGPGFDHVSALFLASFLSSFNNSLHSPHSYPPAPVFTEVRDLFAADWKPLLDSITAAVGGMKGASEASRTANVQCDLRHPSSHPSNGGEALDTFDLFVFSFVLHENHAMLNTGGKLNSTCLVREVLETAKLGCFVACTDAGNTMWPCLEEAAEENGWRVREGGGFQPWKVKMGPKSFVVMERVDFCPIDNNRIPKSL